MCPVLLCAAGPSVKAKIHHYLSVRWNPWSWKTRMTPLGVGETDTTEDICPNVNHASVKHKKLSSLCAYYLRLSIRCLEILQKWLWLQSFIVTRFESFGKKRDSSRVFTTSFLNVSLKILTRLESLTRVTPPLPVQPTVLRLPWGHGRN